MVTRLQPSVEISSVLDAIWEKHQGPVTPQPVLHAKDTDLAAGTVSTLSVLPQSMPMAAPDADIITS